MGQPKKRERLTIDIPCEEHRKIKAYAALRGQSLREFVLGSIKNQMALDGVTPPNGNLRTLSILIPSGISFQNGYTDKPFPG